MYIYLFINLFLYSMPFLAVYTTETLKPNSYSVYTYLEKKVCQVIMNYEIIYCSFRATFSFLFDIQHFFRTTHLKKHLLHEDTLLIHIATVVLQVKS